MPRRDHGWIYEARDRDGVDLYVGKHDGPHPFTRMAQHERNDAEWTRHMETAEAQRFHRDDLDHEEQMRIKAGNGRQGTVFNYKHNGQHPPGKEDYVDRYYDGYDTRYGDEERTPRKAADRRARAGDHVSYQGRRKRRKFTQSGDM